MTTTPDVIGKVSYDGRGGFIFTDTGDIVKFTNHQYECILRKSAVNAIEYRIVRNYGYLIYALIVGVLFAGRFITAPEAFTRQLSGYWGSNTQLFLLGLGASGLLSLAAYFYPNAKLIIHAGSFKCVIDGPDEKLIRIASRLHV
ncbi:hypothetical protein Dgeo_1367 [Deinococcus geothermalis DSM 11300]|uniref:Uncharacterized protein n=1 Tax=Deinococcus geothermalis (strain DSM 11300 / CIP 105573 / AG-3a) TaxID=319795 RepID=Q1IYM2_DEIGD|nr:hypothetical protein [Deinococcus geothermalis]ABF45662.1 hypothetical protein Dgeo_1367 [Deinococcus geothermalis DSM 11300]